MGNLNVVLERVNSLTVAGSRCLVKMKQSGLFFNPDFDRLFNKCPPGSHLYCKEMKIIPIKALPQTVSFNLYKLLQRGDNVYRFVVDEDFSCLNGKFI